MDFNRYIKLFYINKGNNPPELIKTGWGVYQFPDGQNQFWFKPERDPRKFRVDICVNNPTILDLSLQIAESVTADIRILYKYGARSDKSENGNKRVANVANLYTDLFNKSSNLVEYLVPHDQSGRVMHYTPPIDLNQYEGIIFPDQSASERQDWISNDFPFLTASKVRNQLTGEITDYHIAGFKPGKKYLVVDDLCDGGATFLKLAELMDFVGGSSYERDLYVTHGVFSNKAVSKLTANYNKVYTTNSYIHPEDSEYASFNFYDPNMHIIENGNITVFNVWGI